MTLSLYLDLVIHYDIFGVLSSQAFGQSYCTFA